ncbi:MAG: TIGR00730 family Rossman fold protein [Bacteroidota bacterium]
MKSIAVYCGSRFGNHPIYEETAEAVAKAMVERKIDLVYGGGDVGLMGITANTVLEGGGKVTGVITDFLKDIEGHFNLTESIVVETMHERKAIMEKRSDGFIILPGGFGTMDEFMEILTWSQLKLHRKPIGLLNVNHYYDHLMGHVETMLREGFIRAEYRELIIDDTDVNRLLDRMEEFEKPQFILGEDTFTDPSLQGK